MNITKEEFIVKFKDFVKDHPDLNKLITEEFTPTMIEFAIEEVLDDYNNTPPIFAEKVTFDNFPSFRLMFLGTIIFLLEAQQLWYSRNRLPYVDGDITIDPYNKLGEYASLLNMFVQQYISLRNSFKKTKNMENFYGVYKPIFTP
ncbi:MAG: hypothetical protein QXP66_00930 [Candidatus Aenigmatarchaeota archaeon]